MKNTKDELTECLHYRRAHQNEMTWGRACLIAEALVAVFIAICVVVDYPELFF